MYHNSTKIPCKLSLFSSFHLCFFFFALVSLFQPSKFLAIIGESDKVYFKIRAKESNNLCYRKVGEQVINREKSIIVIAILVKKRTKIFFFIDFAYLIKA